MNKNTTRVISLLAVMLALLFVAMTLDRAISVWSPVSFAIVSTATVSTFALLKRKFQVAIAAGFFFGIASLVTAFMFGKTTFYNPLVAILPRAFVGITGYGVYRLVALIVRKIKNERIREYIALSFGGAFVALSNTIYTLTCMFLFAQGDPLFVAFVGVFITNVLPELLCSIIVTPLLVLGVRRELRLNVDGSERIKKVEKTDE